MGRFRSLPAFILLLISVFLPLGCWIHTYPEARLKEALLEICRKEYGIETLEVRIVGNTVGVYLPLAKFFSTDDFKSALRDGKVRNLDTLFDPSPEAREKIQDVLLSISRVILSTDMPVKFYMLQVSDVEKTGFEFTFTGYVDDIKRVRIMDISRDEYNRRILHELHLNRAIFWHRPVRQFFKDLELLTDEELRRKYFKHEESSQKNIIRNLLGIESLPLNTAWDIERIRSAVLRDNEILVHVKVLPRNWQNIGRKNVTDFQFFFILKLQDQATVITRIVPFQFLDDQGQLKKIPLPSEFQAETQSDNWEEEFRVDEVFLGPFLARQLTRRVQALVTGDERIQNTFRSVKLEFEYHEGRPEYFSLNLVTNFRGGPDEQVSGHYSRESVMYHEDMIYLLTLASREFVNVVHSYRFGDFDYLSLNFDQDLSGRILAREPLELFRRKKIDLTGLLNLAKI